MKTGMLNKAQKCCANWNTGNCLGANFAISKDGTVYTWVDPDFASKKCKVETGCDYFKHIASKSLI